MMTHKSVTLEVMKLMAAISAAKNCLPSDEALKESDWASSVFDSMSDVNGKLTLVYDRLEEYIILLEESVS